MHENHAATDDSGATVYSTPSNYKMPNTPNESTILTSNQTYFADEKIKIPESSHVSFILYFYCEIYSRACRK